MSEWNPSWGPRPEYGRHAGKFNVVLGSLFFGGLIVGSDVLLDISMIGARQSERATEFKRHDFAKKIEPEYRRSNARDKFIQTYVNAPKTTINTGDGLVGALFGKHVNVTPLGGSDCLADTPYDPVAYPDVQVTRVPNNTIIITPSRSDLQPLRLDLSNGLYGYMGPADQQTQAYLDSKQCPPSSWG